MHVGVADENILPLHSYLKRDHYKGKGFGVEVCMDERDANLEYLSVAI